MSLFTKCVFKEREMGDGVRVSVMSRHTLNDGITPDSRITEKYDEHLPTFGPRPNLIGDYYKRGLSWESFVARYLERLRSKQLIPMVTRLATKALSEDITLLCVELTPERCHRRLLAEECLKYQPNLILEHH